MFIIGHRGAAGIAPENTVASIEAAAREGVDMVEFDIQPTKDGHFIVFHDDNLQRFTDKDADICDLTLQEINVTATHSGHPIPTLHEALEAAGDVPVLLDCKGTNWAKKLIHELERYPEHAFSVSSGDLKELLVIAQSEPKIKTYLSELTRPFGAIYTAKTYGLSGISLNFWVLSPLSYSYARSVKCKILVYSVNRPILARFLHLLYPRAAIITDVPHKLAKLSKRRKASKRRSGKPKGKPSTKRRRSRR